VRREQTLAAVEDFVEHRRRVGHRAADHLQHFSRGGLLLKRLLRLVEESHVLNCDHRLVGERLHELDLRRRKRTHLPAQHGDDADGLFALKQWHVQHRAKSVARLEFTHVGIAGLD
jgi:hypothetical protein